MKIRLLALVFAAMTSFGLLAQVPESFEVNRLFYQEYNDLSVRIIPNPDGSPYTGTITLPNEVTAPNGKTYSVYKNVSGVFYGIEKLIVDMIPYEEGTYPPMSLSIQNASKLTSIKFNRLTTQSPNPVYNFVDIGNNAGCVYCYVRPGETENCIKVETFNVYGPEGKQLKPALRNPETGEFIYPDSDKVFHLDAYWGYNGNYVGIDVNPNSQTLSIRLYGVADNGEYISMCSTPPVAQSGMETVKDGIVYSISGGEAIIFRINYDATLPENLEIPLTVDFEGQDYPVTTFSTYVFNQALTSRTVKFPLTVTKVMGSGSLFTGCPNLESVDFSKMNLENPDETYIRFDNCPSLKEVKWPKNLTRMSGTFYMCESLENITVPSTVKSLNRTFWMCPKVKTLVIPDDAEVDNLSIESGLVETQSEWISDDTYKVEVSYFGVSRKSKNIEYCPYTVGINVELGQIFHDGVKTDGYFILNKDAFYTVRYPGVPAQFDGTIYIGDRFKDQYNNEIQNRYCTIIAKEASAGVTEVTEDVIGAVRYFNLQGLEVSESHLRPGLYIRMQGQKSQKILIK